MRKILASIATGLVAGTLAFTAPAQAYYSDCASYEDTVCFHQHGNFTGTVWRQRPGQIINCRDLGPNNFNDKASTIFNSTNDHILYAYEHSNCRGQVFSLTPGGVRSFAQTDTWWNDRISSVSVKWVGN